MVYIALGDEQYIHSRVGLGRSFSGIAKWNPDDVEWGEIVTRGGPLGDSMWPPELYSVQVDAVLRKLHLCPVLESLDRINIPSFD